MNTTNTPGDRPLGVVEPIQQSLFKTFSKAQVASLSATAVDYGATVVLVELAGAWYVAATALGAFLGAVTNFLMNRHWSFQATHVSVRGQATRYLLVSAGSLALNTVAVYGFTDGLGFKYMISKVVASLMVGFFYNFPLHRWFVFKS